VSGEKPFSRRILTIFVLPFWAAVCRRSRPDESVRVGRVRLRVWLDLDFDFGIPKKR
jgi:hypothetical protein